MENQSKSEYPRNKIAGGWFVRGRFIGVSDIPEEILRSEFLRRASLKRQRITGGRRGRPKVVRPCQFCGAELPARELHRHRCPQRDEAIRVQAANLRAMRNLGWAFDIARLAGKSLPPSVDREDLQQHASIALMKASREYDPKPQPGYEQGTPFRVYAYPYVYYGCLMAYRGRHFRDVTHEELPEVEAQECSDQAERAEMLDRLRGAIAALPPLQAAVVSLVYFGQRTVSEAAAEVGVGKGYASQMHRAGLTQLKRVLSERGITRLGDVL